MTGERRDGDRERRRSGLGNKSTKPGENKTAIVGGENKRRRMQRCYSGPGQYDREARYLTNTTRRPHKTRQRAFTFNFVEVSRRPNKPRAKIGTYPRIDACPLLERSASQSAVGSPTEVLSGRHGGPRQGLSGDVRACRGLSGRRSGGMRGRACAVRAAGEPLLERPRQSSAVEPPPRRPGLRSGGWTPASRYVPRTTNDSATTSTGVGRRRCNSDTIPRSSSGSSVSLARRCRLSCLFFNLGNLLGRIDQRRPCLLIWPAA